MTSASPVASRSGLDPSRTIQYALFAITALLVIGPLLPVFYQALLDRPLYEGQGAVTTLNFSKLLVSSDFHGVIGNTLVFAVIVTLLAQVIGVVTAILVGRTDMPGRAWLGDLLIWPLFISHLLLAFGWYMMYGPAGYVTLFVKSLFGAAPWDLYTIPGMAVVGASAQAPLAYLYCLAAINAADPNVEDAARSAGAGPLRVMWSVTLPLLRPAIIYGLMMNFVIGIEMLSIPLVFGKPAEIGMFSTFLYEQAMSSAVPDHGIIAAASIFMLAIVLLMLVLQNRLTAQAQRFVTVGGKAARQRRFALGPLRWAAFAIVFLYVLISIGLTIGGMVLRSATEFLTPLVPFWELFSWTNYDQLLNQRIFLQAIRNTLLIAVLGELIGTFLIVMIGLVAERSDFRLRGALAYLAQFPRALPGIFGGLAILYLLLFVPGLGWLRNTIWALVLAYVIRYIPTGIGAVVPSLQQISRDLDLSARSVGASWWTSCRAIVIPMLKPAMFSCFALLFIHFLKEYVTAVFLVAPGSEVIGSTLLLYWENGEDGPVAALATVQIAITVIFVFMARKLLGVRIYG